MKQQIHLAKPAGFVARAGLLTSDGWAGLAARRHAHTRCKGLAPSPRWLPTALRNLRAITTSTMHDHALDIAHQGRCCSMAKYILAIW